VGNSKGGCILGGTLAAILRRDFHPMLVSRREGDVVVHQEPQVGTPLAGDLKGKRVLIVDDMAVTGRTFEFIRARVAVYGPAEVRTLSLARHGTDYRPDYCGITSDDAIAFPWDRWIYSHGGWDIHPELALETDGEAEGS
jgi:hypoxanthine phosphoribosyltransferase